MKEIRIIADGAGVENYLADLRRRGVKEIAFDLEADQGSYRYRYSISIVQCFDGKEPVVIDVLALARGKDTELDALKELLEAPEVVKVMFSSKNDLFITQNVLDCGISPIRDIAVAQKLLGLKVNLAAHLGIEKTAKDGFQRANWLKRPIAKDLLAYAVGDVEKLLAIEADLRTALAEKRLGAAYEKACRALPDSDYRVDQYRLYERKFPGFQRLPSEKKTTARLVWIFRELIGERFDCPVGYVLSTKALPELLKATEESLGSRLEKALNAGRRPERRISGSLVEETLKEARSAIAENRAAARGDSR